MLRSIISNFKCSYQSENAKNKFGVMGTLTDGEFPPLFLSVYIPPRLEILNERLNKRCIVQNRIFYNFSFFF